MLPATVNLKKQIFCGYSHKTSGFDKIKLVFKQVESAEFKLLKQLSLDFSKRNKLFLLNLLVISYYLQNRYKIKWCNG